MTLIITILFNNLIIKTIKNNEISNEFEKTNKTKKSHFLRENITPSMGTPLQYLSPISRKFVKFPMSDPPYSTSHDPSFNLRPAQGL